MITSEIKKQKKTWFNEINKQVQATVGTGTAALSTFGTIYYINNGMSIKMACY